MRWAGGAYPLVVGLSVLSAGLGLGRELFLFHALGLTRVNDRLQLCLSITYTISLLGEPARLASMNMLRSVVEQWRLIAMVAVAAGITIGVSILFGTQFEPPARWWIPVAAIAGLANLGYSAALPRFQQGDRIVMVHAVSVLPNVLLFFGLVILAGGLHRPADATLLLLTLVAPLSQLGLLGLIRPHMAAVPSGRGGPVAWRQLSAHVGAALGLQLAQGGARARLGLAPDGSLALFILMARAGETVRAVLIDTYIAVRVRRWAQIPGPGPTRQGTVPWGGVWLLVSLVWATAARPALQVVLATFMAAGVGVSGLVRIRYHRLNVAGQPTALSARVAWTEGLIGAMTMGLAVTLVRPDWLVVWVVYVARPFLLARLVSDPRLIRAGG